MKQPKVIAAGLVKKGNKYLLVKELIRGEEYWIVPGGSLEFGETLEQATLREIKEETGLKVKIIKLLAYKEAIFPEYNYHTVIFFYLLNPQTEEIILEGKVLEAKYFTKKEAKKLNLIYSAKWLFSEFKGQL